MLAALTRFQLHVWSALTMRSFSPTFGPLAPARRRELDVVLFELVTRRELGAAPRDDGAVRPADNGDERVDGGERMPSEIGVERRPASGRSKSSLMSSGRSLKTHALRSTFSSWRTLPGHA